MKAHVSPRKLSLSTTAVRVLIAAAAVMLTAWTQLLPLSGGSYFANEWLRDSFIRLHASNAPESRIVVIDIDESSLTSVGPWPWPRARLATLMENLLSVYEARGVALDMVLPERADAEADMRLALLAQHGPVVLAQAFDYTARPAPLRVGQVAGGSLITAPAAMLPMASGYIGNHAGLAQAGRVGNIGVVPDEDGALRRLPMLTLFDGRLYPSLSLQLLNCCANAGTLNFKPAAEAYSRIPFSRNWSAYTVVAAADILNLHAPVAAVSGRLVLVGSSALSLSDRIATPLSVSTSGVMVHAAQLSALLDAQAGIIPSPWPGQWIAIMFSMLVAAMAVYTFPRLSAASTVVVLSSTALIWLALAYVISPHDAVFSTTGPLASTLFLLMVAVPFDWQVTQRKARQLQGMLQQYVAKSVVDELVRSNAADPLAPVRRNVTTLIADMEGYTSQVESLSMEQAAQLTHDFLDCLTRPVLAQGGTLDKYTGDGLVAFWGAPLPISDHADLALDAAQQILLEVQRFSLARQQHGKSPLRVRIGIESGVAMAGDFGSSSRIIYTAVGDCVNVASRLQELARDLPHDILIGQGTATLAQRHRLRLLGEVTLCGKEKLNKLYTLESV